ncbi:MAG: hypothetical protein ACC642_07155 [Pseudomonadales bacterium]
MADEYAPESTRGGYLGAAQRLLPSLPEDTILFGAHRLVPPGPPTLQFSDLQDLHSGLLGIQSGSISGSKVYPREFPLSGTPDDAGRTSMVAELGLSLESNI